MATRNKKWQTLQTRTELSLFRVGVQLHNNENNDDNALVSADLDNRCLRINNVSRGSTRLLKIHLDHCFSSATSSQDVFEKSFMNIVGEGAAQGYNTGIILAGVGKKFEYERTQHFKSILNSFSQSLSHLDTPKLSYCHFGIPGTAQRCLDLIDEIPIDANDLKRVIGWQSMFRPIDNLQPVQEILNQGCTVPNILVVRVESSSSSGRGGACFIGTLYLVDLGRPVFSNAGGGEVQSEVVLGGPFSGILKVADVVSGVHSPGPIPYSEHVVTSICSEILGGNGIGMMMIHVDAQDVDIHTLQAIGKFSDSLRRIRNRTAMVLSDPRVMKLEHQYLEATDRAQKLKKLYEQTSNEVIKKSSLIEQLGECYKRDLERAEEIEKEMEVYMNKYLKIEESNTQKELKKLESEYEVLIDKLSAANVQIEILQKETESQTRQIKQYEELKLNLKRVITDQESQINTLQEQISALNSNLDETALNYEQELDRLQRDREVAAEELKVGAAKEVEVLRQEFEHEKKRLEKAKNEQLEKLRKEMKVEVEKVREEADRENDVLMEEVRRVREEGTSEVADVRKEKDKEIADVKKEVEGLKKRVKELEKGLEKKEVEVGKIREKAEQDVDKEKTRVAELEKKLGKETQKLEIMESRFSLAEETFAKRGELYNQHVSGLKDLIKDIKTASDEQQERYRAQIQDLINKLDQARNNPQAQQQATSTSAQSSNNNTQNVEILQKIMQQIEDNSRLTAKQYEVVQQQSQRSMMTPFLPSNSFIPRFNDESTDDDLGGNARIRSTPAKGRSRGVISSSSVSSVSRGRKNDETNLLPQVLEEVLESDDDFNIRSTQPRQQKGKQKVTAPASATKTGKVTAAPPSSKQVNERDDSPATELDLIESLQQPTMQSLGVELTIPLENVENLQTNVSKPKSTSTAKTPRTAKKTTKVITETVDAQVTAPATTTAATASASTTQELRPPKRATRTVKPAIVEDSDYSDGGGDDAYEDEDPSTPKNKPASTRGRKPAVTLKESETTATDSESVKTTTSGTRKPAQPKAKTTGTSASDRAAMEKKFKMTGSFSVDHLLFGRQDDEKEEDEVMQDTPEEPNVTPQKPKATKPRTTKAKPKPVVEETDAAEKPAEQAIPKPKRKNAAAAKTDAVNEDSTTTSTVARPVGRPAKSKLTSNTSANQSVATTTTAKKTKKRKNDAEEQELEQTTTTEQSGWIFSENNGTKKRMLKRVSSLSDLDMGTGSKRKSSVGGKSLGILEKINLSSLKMGAGKGVLSSIGEADGGEDEQD
ncbi:hypothetical protein HK098_000924 [Nowakowskiella sp. JEL0407]|nr:hypothetical protein HK098_000924 [Nowakowskiella sp. JEL0407]